MAPGTGHAALLEVFEPLWDQFDKEKEAKQSSRTINSYAKTHIITTRDGDEVGHCLSGPASLRAACKGLRDAADGVIINLANLQLGKTWEDDWAHLWEGRSQRVQGKGGSSSTTTTAQQGGKGKGGKGAGGKGGKAASAASAATAASSVIGGGSAGGADGPQASWCQPNPKERQQQRAAALLQRLQRLQSARVVLHEGGVSQLWKLLSEGCFTTSLQKLELEFNE